MVSHEVVVKMLAGAAVIRRLRLGLKDPLPRWLTYMDIGNRPQFLTGCWQKASVPHHMDVSIGLSIECPYNMAAGLPQIG